MPKHYVPRSKTLTSSLRTDRQTHTHTHTHTEVSITEDTIRASVFTASASGKSGRNLKKMRKIFFSIFFKWLFINTN